AVLAGAAQAAGADALAVGTPAQGVLAPGQALRWPVQVPVGQVVQGDFDAPGAVLDVIGAEGRHLRRLVGAGGGPQGFTWQVQTGEQLQVRAGPQPQGSAYTLNLRRALALGPSAP